MAVHIPKIGSWPIISFKDYEMHDMFDFRKDQYQSSKYYPTVAATGARLEVYNFSGLPVSDFYRVKGPHEK